jgi:hypothetical protein
LITENNPRELSYPDGNKGFGYVGIHLTEKIAAIGSPWSSRNPKVICHVDDLVNHLRELREALIWAYCNHSFSMYANLSFDEKIADKLVEDFLSSRQKEQPK